MRLLAAVLAASIAVMPLASAQVFKWTDSAGKTHYGDKPPEEAKAEALKMQARSYEGPAQVQDWAQIIRAKSKYADKPAPRGIVMYSTTWCPHCKRAKAYFAQKGVSYEEIDVEASESGRKAFQELGGGGVPLILVNGKAMRGFSPERMDALLKGG